MRSRLATIITILVIVVAGLIIFCELVYVPPSRKAPKSIAVDVDANDAFEEMKPAILPDDKKLDAEQLQDDNTDDEKKEAILLVHGAYGSNALWQHIIANAWPKERRSQYQIVIPSLYGHGKSPHPMSMKYTVKEHVDSLLDVLRRFVPPGRRLHVVGLSLGAPLSIALCARLVRTLAPWPLHSLVLVAPAYFSSMDRATVLKDLSPYLKSTLQNTKYIVGQYVIPKFRFIIDPFLLMVFKKRLQNSEYLNQTIRNAVGANIHVLACSFESLMVRYDVDAGLVTLREVSLPITVIDGEMDTIYKYDPNRADMMRVVGPHGRRCTIANGDHLFCIFQPQLFVDRLLEHFHTVKS